ncbi:MAG: putative dienelactone hydrolase [Arenicella sp.]|jgi:predicted dienelactone hydrolase
MWWLNAPQDLAENSQSLARLDRAAYSVGKVDLEILDLSRETPALGDFEGDDKRTLNGTIWFPNEKKSTYPLIVYSHGFASYHKESTHIAKYLASNGYIVAAVDFPLSKNTSPAGVPQLVDVVNQPGDVSAVIDHILKLNTDSDSALYQQVEADNIGAMGLSLGGLTTALVSFHPDRKDSRIKAAIMMAPPLEGFSDKFYATNPEVKSLLISGSMDRVVPEPKNATEVIARHPNGWFISIDKGTHLGFADVGSPLRWMENPDNLGCLFMNMMLPKLELPERWDAVLANTGGVLRDVAAAPPCPKLPGESINGLKQQWLTRLAAGSFFDMHLQSGDRAISASEFFTSKLSSENPAIRLTAPR